MTSLDDVCKDVFGLVIKSVLDDGHWRAFGYPKRPKRGKIFTPLAMKILGREFYVVSFAQIFKWALKKLLLNIELLLLQGLWKLV